MKKICPYHKYDILRITHWLNEMFSYGWGLTSWGIFFCEFTEYEGIPYQYQLDMDNWEAGANEERRVQLEELGWEYVDTIGGTTIHIYRSMDREAVIPVNAEFIEYNRKKFRGSLVYGIVGILLTLSTFLVIPVSYLQFGLLQLAENDKGRITFFLVFAFSLVLKFFHDDWNYHQLYKYLDKKATSISFIETEREAVGEGVRLPLGMIYWMLIVGALIFLLWTEYVNPKSYAEPLLAERYYEYYGGQFPEPLDEESNLSGSYWMNVSKNVDKELFEQILERYAGYSNYFGYSIFRKEKYDTHDLWKVTESQDERFDRLVIAEGRREFLGDGLIFIQMENDIVYLRYWGERDIEPLLEKVTKIEYR